VRPQRWALGCNAVCTVIADVLRDRSASTTLGTSCAALTQHHILEDLNLKQFCCANLQSCMIQSMLTSALSSVWSICCHLLPSGCICKVS
jgi:hypothetical protein